MRTLGIDTSNYTTSVCIYDSENGIMLQKKLLLPVKEGEKGLRQSDAVFAHVRNFPSLMAELAPYLVEGEVAAVACSTTSCSISTLIAAIIRAPTLPAAIASSTNATWLAGLPSASFFT